MSNGGEICVQAYGHTVERPRVVVFRMVGHHQGKPRLRWVRSEYRASLLSFHEPLRAPTWGMP